MTTVGIDPRQGLRPNLNLLSAYKLYEQDYPAFKPDISATLAMNSPLYKRIEDTLTDQSQMKAEHDADQARMRNAAITANVPLEPMRQMMAALLQETRPPAPAHQAAAASLDTAHMQVDGAQGAQLMAEQQQLVTDQQLHQQAQTVAAAVAQCLNQTFATPIQDLLQGLAAVHNTMQTAAQSQAIVRHSHSQPITQHFHNDNRQVALVDARQALQQILQQDNRYVQLFQANQTNVAQVDASQNLHRHR